MIKGLLTILYWLSPLVPIAVTLAAYPARYASAMDALPMLLGATAFTWLMAQLVLSARIRFIERHFGLDSLMRLHAITPILIIVLALIHKFLMERLFGESLKTQLGTAGLIFLITVSTLAVVFLGGMAGRFIAPIVQLRKALAVNKAFRYRCQRLLHMLSPLGALILFIHVLLSSSARFNMGVRLVYTLYFAIASGTWIWHKLFRPWQQRRHPFTVREVRQESAGIWTLRLTAPDINRFRHAEGQFGFIKFLTGSMSREPHPFSFSSMQDDHGTLTMTIKELGDFTRTIGQAKPGDMAAIDGPYGRFTPSLHKHEQLVLLAGGIGITPMLSILNHMQITKPTTPVLLIWGINTSSEIIRPDFLKELQQDMPGFHFIPVVFRQPGFDGETGLIDREKIERLTQTYGFDSTKTGYYLCGPTPMTQSVRKTLRLMAIPRSHIHDEQFSL